MKNNERNRPSKLEEIVEAESPFARTLEQDARALIAERRKRHSSCDVTDAIEQEIEFALDQIDRLRAVQQEQLKSLLRAECYAGTELKQMEERTPRYSPYRFPEREKFHQRLFTIDAEWRKHVLFHEERIQALQKKLLSLMQKWGSCVGPIPRSIEDARKKSLCT